PGLLAVAQCEVRASIRALHQVRRRQLKLRRRRSQRRGQQHHLRLCLVCLLTRGGRRYGVESRMIDNKARRRTASIPAAFAFVALAIAGCGGTAPESGSANSTV